MVLRYYTEIYLIIDYSFVLLFVVKLQNNNRFTEFKLKFCNKNFY